MRENKTITTQDIRGKPKTGKKTTGRQDDRESSTI